MPIADHFTCEICGTSVDDADLLADETGALRRLLADVELYRPITGTPTVVEHNSTGRLVFCGFPHAEAWVEAIAAEF